MPNPNRARKNPTLTTAVIREVLRTIDKTATVRADYRDPDAPPGKPYSWTIRVGEFVKTKAALPGMGLTERRKSTVEGSRWNWRHVMFIQEKK